MTINEFRNALNIMTSIDRCDLEATGIRMSWMRWESFSNDPAGYFVRADDGDAAKLWSIIEGRMKR